jgi:hypothetical protein
VLPWTVDGHCKEEEGGEKIIMAVIIGIDKKT